jgi:hypothetical protein
MFTKQTERNINITVEHAIKHNTLTIMSIKIKHEQCVIFSGDYRIHFPPVNKEELSFII